MKSFPPYQSVQQCVELCGFGSWFELLTELQWNYKAASWNQQIMQKNKQNTLCFSPVHKQIQM